MIIHTQLSLSETKIVAQREDNARSEISYTLKITPLTTKARTTVAPKLLAELVVSTG